MELNTWAATLNESINNLWAGIIEFLPELIIAILILVVGWIIGAVLGKLIAQIIRSLKIDEALRGTGLEKMVHRAGFKLNSGAFVGGLIKWFIIAAFLIAALDVLGLDQVNNFLQRIVLVFLPQVIVAVLILLAGALIAEVMENVVRASASGAHLRSSSVLGKITKWAIWIFAALAALLELGVAVAFIQTLFTGVVVALALAFGLSFGLGGQEEAARYLKRIREEVSAKNE